MNREVVWGIVFAFKVMLMVLLFVWMLGLIFDHETRTDIYKPTTTETTRTG